MRSFDYFTGEFPEFDLYTRSRFCRTRVELYFWRLPRLGGLRVQHLVGAHWLARRFPTVYERFFAYILPAQLIRYELEVIKPGATQPSVPEHGRSVLSAEDHGTS